MCTKKKIAVIGDGYKDFAVYLAFVLNNLGYIVRVFDWSKEKEMSFLFGDKKSKFFIDEQNVMYRGIEFCNKLGDRQSTQIIDENEISITYFGNNQEYEEINHFDFIIINTDVQKKNLLKNIGFVRNVNKDIVLVLRDCVANGINSRYLRRNYSKYTDKIMCIYDIEFDMVDKEYQYNMDYDGVRKFKYLSKKYCDTLEKICILITGGKRGEISKVLKNTMGGKIIDNRLLE